MRDQKNESAMAMAAHRVLQSPRTDFDLLLPLLAKNFDVFSEFRIS